jgi:preprotein translocase subunit SecA
MPVQTDDKVWFNSQRKFAGICADVVSLKAQQQNTLLLAHFPETLSIVQSAFRAATIEFTLAESSTLYSASRQALLSVGLARGVHPSAQIGQSSSKDSLEIVVAEHHPVYAKDKGLIDLAERLPCKPRVCFHTSLDEPLMRYFGSEKIISLFKLLGADEAECISHPLVTTAIRSAQQKIEKQVQRDVHTESMEDWFEFNLRAQKW